MILVYHGVSVRSEPNCIPLSDFRAHLKFIKNRYRIVSLIELLEMIKEDRFDHCNVLAVTFDDAYENFARYAYPELLEMKIPATVFVPAGMVGKTNAWDQKKGSRYAVLKLMDYPLLRELDRNLVDIGSHGWSHSSLTAIPKSKLKEEICLSKIELKEKLGRKVEIFAYPHGQLRDFNQGIICM